MSEIELQIQRVRRASECAAPVSRVKLSIIINHITSLHLTRECNE
jgi:hypothetical protein